MQTICNIIILIGGTCLALDRIFEWFGRPIKFTRKKSQKRLEETIRKIVNETWPSILEEHDKETRKKYLSDREKYLNDIKDEVLDEVKEELTLINKLNTQYQVLVLSAKDVLREKIMLIYHKNRPTRTLTFHEREALTQYYKDYKAMGGNSYIDRYYNRMADWDTIDDDYDI